MSLSIQDQIALLRSLCIILRSDNEFPVEERSFLSNFISTFRLPLSCIQESAQMSNNEMERRISSFSPTEKEATARLWIDAIKADRTVEFAEVNTLLALGESCNIDIEKYLK